MLRLPLILVLLTHSIRTAYVTNTPSHGVRLDRLHRLYEKLEQVNSPTTQAPHTDPTTESAKTEKPNWKRKLEELEALTPESFYLSQEDEELLKTMQVWGQLSREQLDGVAKDLFRIRETKDERILPVFRQTPDQELTMSDYDGFDEYPADADYEYRNDANDGKDDDDDDDEELEPSSEPPFRAPPGVTPSAFTRDETYRLTNLSAVESMAATNERPEVLEGSELSAASRSTLRQEILDNIRYVLNNNRCKEPQPRWLVVRQLAPAADTLYVPPSVRLHRCVPDTGCCNNDSEICAPVNGTYVYLPFFLKRLNNMSMARIKFYNHTECACVKRDTLRQTVKGHRERLHQEDRRQEKKQDGSEDRRRDRTEEIRGDRGEERKEERQNDWHPPTEQPSVEEDVTSPPLMSRRCTCPAEFLASMPESGPCSCICEWHNPIRRRTCMSFSRGEEHFSLRDRFCVKTGDCTSPTCKYGPYDTNIGKCPYRSNRYRRLRYHSTRRYQPEKALVV